MFFGVSIRALVIPRVRCFDSLCKIFLSLAVAGALCTLPAGRSSLEHRFRLMTDDSILFFSMSHTLG